MCTGPHMGNARTVSKKTMLNPREKCPNCGSTQFRETVDREYCPNCGLECDYHHGGANSIYIEMMRRQAAQEEYESYMEDLAREDEWE